MTAPDLCQRTWRSHQPTRTDDTHRQHRCGLAAAEHRYGDDCVCRYCRQPRAADLDRDRGDTDFGTIAWLGAVILIILCALGVLGEQVAP